MIRNVVIHECLNEKDIELLGIRGITLTEIDEQLERYQKGIKPIKLLTSCKINDGITKLDTDVLNLMQESFSQIAFEKKITTFIPASGAATRMFKELLELYYSDDFEEQVQSNEYFNIFISNLSEFSFYQDLTSVLRNKNLNINTLINGKEYRTILRYLLTDEGLGYAHYPKGLIPFHKYSNEVYTPLMEHIQETIAYAEAINTLPLLHFTVSEIHLEKIQKHIRAFLADRNLSDKIDISYSLQKSSTEVMAVDLDNRPFRDQNGQLLFRPAGHGALIENLNEIDSDLIIIRNVDNVTPFGQNPDSLMYKRILTTFLLELQSTLFSYMEKMQVKSINPGELKEIINFINDKLHLSLPDRLIHEAENGNCNNLILYLDRPLRVCGMVKNTGDPGGGPFWVLDEKGNISLQIVETSQINKNDPEQKKILESATHFNPVDLVCSVKNYKGEKFDLLKFRDPETGFIVKKTFDGRELKSLELPGLWNGAMAHWITVFVEVPITIFNPVKTVNDLLKPAHCVDLD